MWQAGVTGEPAKFLNLNLYEIYTTNKIRFTVHGYYSSSNNLHNYFNHFIFMKKQLTPEQEKTLDERFLGAIVLLIYITIIVLCI